MYMDEKKARKLVSDDFLTRELTEEELALVPKIYESHIPSEIENTVVSHVLRSKHGRYPIKNVLLEGDSGTGKTHMVKMIAARLGAPYVAFTCGAETDKYELEKTLQPMTGDEGQLLFEDILSPILVGFEHGYVVEVQEPNVILSPGILSKLNSILETDGFYDYNGRVIPRHPDFLCFFTMNKETYEGVHELNQAVKQRFQEVYVVDMPSVDEVTERAASINAIKLV
jgi:MoxR-like ATPase